MALGKWILVYPVNTMKLLKNNGATLCELIYEDFQDKLVSEIKQV